MSTPKPKANPANPFPPATDALHREGDWLWIPLRSEWRDVAAKPEEIVRQTYIRTLHDSAVSDRFSGPFPELLP